MDSRIPSSALWNNEAFAEALLQHLAVATFVIDADHKVIFWNKACEALTGLPAEAVIGTRDHWKGFYPVERPCLADIVLDNTFDQSPGLYKKTRLATQIDGLAAESWITSADGVKRFLEFEAGAICNEQGEIIAVIECLRDRTEKKVLYDDLIETHKKVKLAELRSRINEQRFVLALTSSKGAIWEYSPQTEEIETIPSWEELLGFPKENDRDLKQFWLDQVHPDDREKLDTALQQLRNHKTDLVEVEYRIKNSTG
jgi:PAS domain S-box